jgi:O-antigen/teichoic acid export membrane protein
MGTVIQTVTGGPRQALRDLVRKRISIRTRLKEMLRRPLTRAMSATGAAAVASAGLSSIASKILASAGPEAIAVYATLQQVRQASLVAATANGQTALIQGASALGGMERREYVRTAAAIFFACTSFVALMLFLMPVWPANFSLLNAATRLAASNLAIGVALLSSFVFAAALLAAGGKIWRLAASQVSGSVALAAGAWPAASVASGGRWTALAHLLNFSSAVSALSGWRGLREFRETFADWFGGPGRWWSHKAARMFLSISGAMLGSGLLTTGVLLAVRGRIIETQGALITGQFDAAWTISMSHVTLVLGSMQSYYLPALSRARLDVDRANQISDVLAVASLVAASVIAGLAILKPWILRALYSAAFVSGARFLRWTLVGDYLKVASWTLSIAMLARGDIRALLAADVLAYGVFWGGSALFANWAGAAEGAAIAFVAMYTAHLLFCAGVVRYRYGLQLRRKTSGAVALGAFLVALATVLTWNQA